MPLSSDADRLCGLFDDLVLVAARAAATEWGYPAPDQDWADAFAARMPPGLRTVLGRAFETDSASVVDGHRFVLRDLDGKGPYAFFSRSSEREQPAPNWEYFVQLAIWASVDQDVRGRGFVAGFEDGLMDVSVRTTEGELVWAIEVKERSNQALRVSAGCDRGE